MLIGPLTGFTIGVTAHRRAREQIELLERKGATVIHGPSIETHPLAPESGLEAATQEIVRSPPDITMLSTGIGVRAWFEAAESLGLADGLSEALSRSTVMVRGPKAHGAAVTNGIEVAWQTPTGRAAELVDRARESGVAGRRIAIQLDGAAGAPLADRLRELGADVVAVPVYEWSMPTDPGPAERLIEAMCEGRVDGITFTARPQVDNLLTIATAMGRADELRGALAEMVVVCVGPVCAGAVTDLGLPEPVQPERFRLGSMVLATAGAFAARAVELCLAGIDVRVQGRAVVPPEGLSDLGPVLLTDKERAVLDALAERPGVVLSKDQLLARAWEGAESDPHVVEVTVGRLRQRLGPAGAGVETVIRRGYRLTDR